jgi:hypothetical protein
VIGNDFLGRQIARTNRNFLLLGLVLIASITGCAYLMRRQLDNFVRGPFPVSVQELTAMEKSAQPAKYFVTVQGQKRYATGMRVVEQGNEAHVLARFAVLDLGERLLVARVTEDAGSTTLSGVLTPMPFQVQRGIVDSAVQRQPELQDAFLPYVLDTAGLRTRDNVIGVALAGLGLLLGLFVLGLSLSRQTRPESHPVVKALSRYGNAEDFRMRVDSELSAEGESEVFGRGLSKLRITSNWLVYTTPFTTRIMRIEDVLWGFQRVVKHYHNGIPTGKTFSAVIRDAQGQSMEVGGKKDTVPALIESLQKRMPWALMGHTPELEKRWKSGRTHLIQELQERRTKLATAAS